MTYRLQVQPNAPYRVWLRIKRSPGEEEGTLFFVQFAGAADKAGKELFPIDSKEASKVRAVKPGWSWIGLETAVLFRGTEARIRITAGSGGAFDQVVLSPLKYLEKPPSEAVVPRPPK